MATYNELAVDKYHLIQEEVGNNIALVYVLMETEKALLLKYMNDMEDSLWVKKSDPIAEWIETLSEEAAAEYELVSGHIADHFEEDAEDEWMLDELESDDFWDADDIDESAANN